MPGPLALFERWRERQQARWMLRGAETDVAFRRVAIYPTMSGMMVFLGLFSILIVSIRLHLNLGYILMFLAGSAVVLALFLTFAVVNGMRLAALTPRPVFAGDPAVFDVETSARSGRGRHAIDLSCGGDLVSFDFEGQRSRRIRLSVPTTRRGWLDMPPVHLSSIYPIGCWKASARWQPDQRCLVYPRPELNAPPLPLPLPATVDGIAQRSGDEVAAGVRSYAPGDPMRRIAWSSYARTDGQQLSVRQLEAPAGPGTLMLTEGMVAGLPREAAISRLAAWILMAERGGFDYGLDAFGQALQPASGAEHRDACLSLLALVGLAHAGSRAVPEPTPR